MRGSALGESWLHRRLSLKLYGSSKHSIDMSHKQNILLRPVTSKASLGTLTNEFCYNDHSSAPVVDTDWPVHSLVFSINDLRGRPLQRLPSTVL